MLLLLFLVSVAALECRWACDDPVCHSTCVPVCERPVCEVQCNTTAPSRCSHSTCVVQCPRDQLWDESCPMCETVCSPLPSVCHGCTVLCEPTNCAWRCTQGVCAKPECQLQCESPACEAQLLNTPVNLSLRITATLSLFLLLT